MNDLLASWSLAHRFTLPARPAETVGWDDLSLSPVTETLLAASAPAGIFRHQHAALRASIDGEDVCLGTSTASGKSLAFQAAAVERLARDPNARVLAIYPMKALGCEQEERWVRALANAGIRGTVRRLDGSIPTGAPRLAACRDARVLVATPDILHAWMLTRMGQKGNEAIARFLAHTSLVVVDEVHTYSGVFGSNAAFLFRRLLHAMATLGARPSLVAASATVSDPATLLTKLFGRTFTVVGPEADTSPRHPVEVVMVQPPQHDFHGEMCGLFRGLVASGRRFLAFFDSRKATELMGAAMLRGANDQDGDDGGDHQHLQSSPVLPYRSGYEADHRDQIQRRLTDGSLRGVLSTSALELGLDIPGLEVVVLAGVPSSGTSLTQRIGRVGRSGPGTVFIVHAGSVIDDVVFDAPQDLLARPLAETAIYLESERIQYIHAMALASVGGEDERAHTAAGRRAPAHLTSTVAWPEGFERLCQAEREGRVAGHLREMKCDANSQPTLAFPLRDAEQQFEVEIRDGMRRDRLGSLSWNQVMREAYPGAVHYYTGRPLRVTGVDVRARKVRVTRCKQYTTQPTAIAPRITPQPPVHQSLAHGDLVLAECDLQIWSAVVGYRERRGPTPETVRYPSREWSRDHFSRTLFTTGVCLAHPALDEPGVDAAVLAKLLHEAFLAIVPLDRQDIEASSDAMRATWEPLESGRRFIALYDQTYGSLRLSGRLLEGDALQRTLELVARLAVERDSIESGHTRLDINEATRAAAQELCAALACPPVRDFMKSPGDAAESLVRVMLPTSRGRSEHRPGFQFEVHGVFNRPNLGVCYRGVWIDDATQTRSETVVVPTGDVQPGSGEIVWGTYDPDTGEASLAA